MHKSSLLALPVTLGRLVILAPAIAWLVVAGALTSLPWDAFAQGPGVPNAAQSRADSQSLVLSSFWRQSKFLSLHSS